MEDMWAKKTELLDFIGINPIVWITRAERFPRSKKFMGLITMGCHELGGRSHVMVQIFGATAVREANLLFNASGSQQ
jgi:hypothetical protein